MSPTEEIEEQFLGVLGSFCETYGNSVYYTERDIVFTLQTQLVASLSQYDSGVQVFNDYRISPAARADLVVRSQAATELDASLLAVEFKYEPHRLRPDIPEGKIPVTAWAEIMKDRERTHRFATEGRAEVCYAVLFDEDGRYATRAADVFRRSFAITQDAKTDPIPRCWFDSVSHLM